MLRVIMTLDREDDDVLYQDLIRLGAEDIEIEEFTPPPPNFEGRQLKQPKT